jgi:hypothetical protein
MLDASFLRQNPEALTPQAIQIEHRLAYPIAPSQNGPTDDA